MDSLHLKGVTKSFGPKTVLRPLDFDLASGEYLTLLGPSGCGKTTLLRMIAGLERPTGGEIRIGCLRVNADDGTFVQPEHREIGMVFQSYAVWPHLTVRENIAFPLEVGWRARELSRDERESRVKEAVKLVRLEGLEERFPSQLSGGQQQRVALARALAQQPRILLLDEPLSNLDTRLRGEMRRELRDLHARLGLTVVHVTHDQREAFELSTRVLVLNEGRVEQAGTPAEIRQNPASDWVREFLAE